MGGELDFLLVLEAHDRASKSIEGVSSALEGLKGHLETINSLRGLSSAEDSAAGSSDKLASHASGLSQKLHDNHEAVGKLTTAFGGGFLTAGLAAGGAIGALTGQAGDFQEKMTALVTGAGESKGAIDGVGKGILSLSGNVGVGANQLADGMYMIESAGYHGSQGLTVLKSAAEGAKVGNADMATVADALTSALNAYQMPASKATSVTNQLVATVANGKMHMQDLAGALGTVLPAAAASHVSLAEVGGALATMTMQGESASTAAMHLRQLMLALQAPGGAAKKALEGIGLSATEVGNTLTHKGLAAALQLIETHLHQKFPQGGAAATAALSKMVGGARSMQAVLELTGPHLVTLTKNTQAVAVAAQHAGANVHGWREVQGDLNTNMQVLHAKVEAMEISLGQKLIPIIMDLINKATPLVNEIVHWISTHKELVTQILIGIVAIGGLIGVVTTIAGLVLAFGIVLSPIGLIIAGITLVIIAIILIITHWQQILHVLNTVVTTVFHAIRSVVTSVIHAVENVVGSVLRRIEGVFQRVWHAILSLIEHVLTTIKDRISGAWHSIQSALSAAWHTITNLLSGAWHTITGLVTGAIKGLETALSKAWTTVTGDVSAAWDKIKTMISEALSRIVGDISNAGQSVLDKLKGVWDSVRSTVSNLVNEAFQWGSNLVGNVISGITSRIGDALNAAKNLASSIASAIGFHSPAKVGPGAEADTWGPNLVTMLASGIEDHVGIVASAAQAVAGAANPARGALGGAVGGRAGTSGTTVIIDLRGSTLMNDEDVDRLWDKLSPRLAQFIAPAAGIQFRW